LKSMKKLLFVPILIAAFVSIGTVGFAADVNPHAVRPEAEQAQALHVPKPISYKLPNGLQVALLEDNRVPMVTFQLGIRAGDANDPKNYEGLAEITADMLTEGTTTKTSRQIAEEIDGMGGAMKASADADFTVVSGSALAEYQIKFLDIVADVVENPVFPETELKLEKTNLTQMLSMKRTDPDFLNSERFHKVVFGSHPYSAVSPSPESVAKITREDIVNFHKAHYVPNGSTLVVVGNFSIDKMKELLAAKFGTWAQGKAETTSFAAPPAIKGTKIYLIDRPGSVQSSVKIGNVGISKTDPDYFSTMVANQILGGSANSRLFLNIRENKGYTYGAYSGFSARKLPGEFAASASVRTPVTAPSLVEFLYELNRIRTLPVTKDELTSAKKYLVGNYELGFETQGAVASRLLEQKLYGFPDDYLETYTAKVNSVSPEDVRRVAHKHIDYNNLVITIVGDAKQIEPDLKWFFPVEVYDTQGKLVRRDEASPNG
jgi:zinc protease